jgi:predicted DNA-binding transcriptional regulator AlpA
MLEVHEAGEIYLTVPQLRQRFGGKSDMWLWRLLREEPKFPRPVVIRHQRYFRLSELLAFENASKTMELA